MSLLSCSFLGRKKSDSLETIMDFVGWMWALKNSPPAWPENLFTFWYKSKSNVRSKVVMCHHASKKNLTESFWARYRHKFMQKYGTVIPTKFHNFITCQLWVMANCNFKKRDDNHEKKSSFVTITRLYIFLSFHRIFSRISRVVKLTLIAFGNPSPDFRPDYLR